MSRFYNIVAFLQFFGLVWLELKIYKTTKPKKPRRGSSPRGLSLATGLEPSLGDFEMTWRGEVLTREGAYGSRAERVRSGGTRAGAGCNLARNETLTVPGKSESAEAEAAKPPL